MRCFTWPWLLVILGERVDIDFDGAGGLECRLLPLLSLGLVADADPRGGLLGLVIGMLPIVVLVTLWPSSGGLRLATAARTRPWQTETTSSLLFWVFVDVALEVGMRGARLWTVVPNISEPEFQNTTYNQKILALKIIIKRNIAFYR